MGIIAVGIAITAAVLSVLLFAAFRAGTRRQEDAGSLACRTPGPAAGLTRRITGLYAEPLHPVPCRLPSRRPAGAAPRGTRES
jgi:hypothetical protein